MSKITYNITFNQLRNTVIQCVERDSDDNDRLTFNDYICADINDEADGVIVVTYVRKKGDYYALLRI